MWVGWSIDLSELLQAAGPVSGALCGSVAGSLAEQSARVMERAVGAPLLPAEARQARGVFGSSDIVLYCCIYLGR